MIDKIINFETAKILYTKDFKELINGCYQNFESNDGKKIGDFLPMTNINNQFGELLSAPTQSLLQKWLREIHNIDISIFQTGLFNRCWFFNIYSKESRFAADLTQDSGNNYEGALEKALVMGLNLIKKV